MLLAEDTELSELKELLDEDAELAELLELLNEDAELSELAELLELDSSSIDRIDSRSPDFGPGNCSDPV